MVTAFVPHQWQLDAAQAYADLGGVFIGLDPGVGKTYALALIAQRDPDGTVLCTPAPRQAVAQLRSYGVPAYEAARGPGEGVAVVTYAWLTREAHADFFETVRPRHVLLDEYHMVRGLGHSARRRLERYLVEHLAVRVAVATGSPMSGRLHDFAYGLTWALRSHVRHLVPQLRSGLDALDELLNRSPSAREDFRRRLTETPGVFLDVEAGQYTGKIEFSVTRLDPVAVLPNTWTTPSGVLIESAAHAAEVERQLAWGFYLDAQPPPSRRYLDARRRWGATVRRAIEHGLADTEVQVRAVEPEAYAVWLAEVEREGPVAEPAPVWLPGAAERFEWLARRVAAYAKPPLIWAEHRGLQERVSRSLALPLHREGCRSASTGVLPTEHDSPAVLSVDACYQSYNLQTTRSTNLILEPQADPEIMKQLIGRTARQGQLEPVVTVDLALSGPRAEATLRAAIARAKLVNEMTGKNNPLLTLEY